MRCPLKDEDETKEDNLKKKNVEHESYLTLRAIMEYIPEGILIAEAPDVTIRMVSRFGLLYTGYKRDELENISYEEHVKKWNFFHKGGVTRPAVGELPLYRATTKGETVQDEEWVFTNKEGLKITALCNAGPIFDEKGRIRGGIIAWRDISRRKQSEEVQKKEKEFLKKVLEALPVGVWITDRTGNIVDSNLRAREIWGAGSVGMEHYGQYKGRRVETGEPVKPGEWAAARAIAKGETSFNEEIEVEFLDKTRKFILNSATPILNDRREITGAIIVNQDITKLKLAETEQKKLSLELGKVLKEVKVLSGLLPICASCKRIQDDKGKWNTMERYIEERSEAAFSHSICPDCAKKLYPDLYKEMEKKRKNSESNE